MANRDFKTMQSNIRELKQISLTVAIGASGAPTIDTFSSGYASIVRDNAGEYTVTFVDKYSSFHGASIMGDLGAGGEDLTFPITSTSIPNSTISFDCLAGTAETDPSSGSVLYINAWFSNSSAK